MLFMRVSWTCSSERFLHNLLFLVCNINNNNFFSWAKEIMTHAKEYKIMTCLPSLSQKEILVKLFQSVGTYNTYPGWIPSTCGPIS
uniref:Uncharacterized protein n=1 Tax=Lactuca sativa TaxID=4236 RepID=A0A9R1VZF5_LACSA|nr:hypothetical protein LSAT_V11C300134260 [Lactuca sativa]